MSKTELTYTGISSINNPQYHVGGGWQKPAMILPVQVSVQDFEPLLSSFSRVTSPEDAALGRPHLGPA